MSDPKLISPLLDGFAMGDPISDHGGVRCCPAMREDTGERYIVKIVSIPASQVQLDALLLSGAYENEFQADAYFKDLAAAVEKESLLLSKLSTLEGFVPYQGVQTVKMDDGVGYEIYLLAPYRRTLDVQMKDEPLTQLAAVNLGLDMCAALAVSRRAGLLYADLKPSNIYRTETHGYCLGDLGFIPLSSLKYASLPDKYRSAYTAPEISDAYAALNDRLDIYALGLTLYQVYNNGELPNWDDDPDAPLPSPMYADYEMASIILKACAVDPKDRWADPAQMGQELVNYMQRNGVDDVPIVPLPVAPIEETEGPEEDFLSEEENDAELAALLAMIPEEEPPEDMELPEEVADETGEPAEDMAEIMAQADDLIEHELPEPVVVPEPIDVPIPAPIVDELEVLEELEEEPIPEEAPAEEPQEATEEEPEEGAASMGYQEPKKDPMRRLIGWGIVALILVISCFGAFHFYDHYYLQTVDALAIQGDQDDLTISITADMDHSLLTVICTDTYGNTLRAPVVDGKAYFSGLTPDSHYQIRLEVSGLHKLTGQTTGTYTTGKETKILNFSAVTGSLDGSVDLSFTVMGPAPEKWSIEYFADGIEPQTVETENTALTVTGLTIGKAYTFRIVPQDGIHFSQEYQIKHTVQKVVIAQDLKPVAYGDGKLTITWNAPVGMGGIDWILRCSDGAGQDIKAETTDTTFTFSGLDPMKDYTVTVQASGMSQSQSIQISAGSVTVTGYDVTVTDALTLQITWPFDGPAPTEGWILTYTVSGGETIEVVCSTNTATLAAIPGASYHFLVHAAGDVTCFAQPGDYVFQPTAFSYTNGETVFTASDFVLKLHDADGKEMETFIPGGNARVILSLADVKNSFAQTEDSFTVVSITHVGDMVTTSQPDSQKWDGLTSTAQQQLTILVLPEEAGTYSVDIYVNGMFLGTVTLPTT